MMSASKWTIFVCLLTCVLNCSASDEEKTAMAGHDVTLQCQGPRDSDPHAVMLKWIRADLKSEGFVFYFRESHILEDLQHPSFIGRVELMDQKMEQGNFAVVLKNLTIKDTGTYECYVGNKGNRPQSINTINLTVRHSEKKTAKPGDDVTLQCQGPRDSDIDTVMLKWIRPDLKSEGSVFYYKDNDIQENYQHPSFHGRVELRDPEMKDGNVSLILKNINIKDTGTYECHVGDNQKPIQLISKTNLMVTDVQDSTGGGAGHTGDGGDKGGGDKDGGDKGGQKTNINLAVGLSVFGIVVLLLGFLIYRKCQRRTDSVLYQAAAEGADEQVHVRGPS